MTTRSAEVACKDYVKAVENRAKLGFAKPKTSNALYFQIVERYLELRQMGEEGWRAIEALLSHPSPAVRMFAAVHTYSRDTVRSIRLLDAIAESEEVGEVATDAMMCSRQMREGTYLDPTEWDRYENWQKKTWAPTKTIKERRR